MSLVSIEENTKKDQLKAGFSSMVGIPPAGEGIVGQLRWLGESEKEGETEKERKDEKEVKEEETERNARMRRK